MSTPITAVMIGSDVLALCDDTQVAKGLMEHSMLSENKIEKETFGNARWRVRRNEFTSQKITSEEFYRITLSKIESKRKHLSLEKFSEIWGNVYTERTFIEKALKKIHEQKKVQLLAIANTDDMRWGYLRSLHVFQSLFNDHSTCVLSHHERARKPEIGFYTKARARIGHKNWDQILYVDTNPHDIAAAEILGIRSVLLKDNGPQTVSDLTKLLRSHNLTA